MKCGLVVCLASVRKASEAWGMKNVLLFFTFTLAPAAFFLLLWFFDWNTMPLAVITGTTGLLMGVAGLIDGPDDHWGDYWD